MTSGILKRIQEAARKEAYALRPHAVSHMLAEGFNEKDIIESILDGKIIEHYNDEDRCLIAGTFELSLTSKEYLHIVIDYWSERKEIEWIDIVTAYIPRRPFWETPYRRGKKMR